MPTEKSRNRPQRFLDRKDGEDIIKSSQDFYIRAYKAVPEWVTQLFLGIILFCGGTLVYFTHLMLSATGEKDYVILYLTQCMIVGFAVLASYSIVLLKKLRKAINSAEFISLSLSKTLENFSDTYCLINKEGKVFYLNHKFFSNCISTNNSEKEKYTETLNKTVFDQHALERIKDSLDNDRENILGLNIEGKSVAAKILPLIRPKGIFAIVIFKN